MSRFSRIKIKNTSDQKENLTFQHRKRKIVFNKESNNFPNKNTEEFSLEKNKNINEVTKELSKVNDIHNKKSDENDTLNDISKNIPLDFFTKKRRRNINKKIHIKNNIPDNMENISKNNDEEDKSDLENRPTRKFLLEEKNPDIIIRPYSSFEPNNGVYKKDAHQETSNIRFTNSDRILAEKSGLSWD